MNRALQKICLATFCLTIISSLVLAQKVPHSFEEGGIISAQQMNDNFLVAASKLRKGTVDCTDASPENHESISEKLKDYNYLVINGVCTENVIIDFMNRDVPDNWEWDNMTAFTSMVLLTGTPDDGVDDGITAVDQGARVIDIDGPVAVGLKDLTISGGEGIRGQFGAMIGLQRVTVNNSSKDGLRITRGMGFVNESTFNTNESGITAEYNSTLEVLSSEILNSNDFGIRVTEGSNALVGREPDYDSNDDPDFSSSQGNQIRGGRTGVIVADASFLRMMGNEVSCYTNTGVYAGETSTLDLGMFFENAEIDDDSSHPLHPDNPAYNTNKLYYGNLIDGAVCNGEARRDWHHGIQVREASALRMYRTIIKNNVQHGVYSEGNSSITLGGGNEIKDNGRHGFSLRETTLNQWSGQQELEPSVVTGNVEDAFDLSSSVIHLRGGKISDEFTGEEIQASENRRFVISGHRHGISARNSRITLDRVDIDNNVETGIRVTDNSILNVWRDGARIRGNGVNSVDGWNGKAPGLQIERNSAASVDMLEVSDNGRGVQVDRSSSFSGGWKDENDTNLPNYMVLIKDNLHFALEVRFNSHLDLRNIEISGNNINPDETGDNGETYYDHTIIIEGNSNGDIRDGLISGNGSEAIRVRENSNIEIRNTLIENNNNFKETDNSGNSYHRDTIRIESSSGAQFRNSQITNNYGRTLNVSHNSELSIRDNTIISGNGKDSGGVDSYKGIEVSDFSIIDFDNSTLIHDAEWNSVGISNNSKGGFNGSQITNTLGGGININENSKLEVEGLTVTTTGNGQGISLWDHSTLHMRNSTISSTYTFEETCCGDPFTNGSNGVEASNDSRISLGAWGNSDAGSTITGAAFPLKVRESSQLEIYSPINLTSTLGWNEIQVEQGSKLDLGGDENMLLQDVSYTIQLQQETKANLSDKWEFGQINCSNHNDINNNSIYQDAVIYRNGSPTADENIDGNCIIAN